MQLDFLATLWQRVIDFFTIDFLVTPIKDPVPIFLMILAIMLIAPLLFERIRLPGIVGLIFTVRTSTRSDRPQSPKSGDDYCSLTQLIHH